MKIDIHTHYYAPRFLAAIEKREASQGFEIIRDALHRPVIVHRNTRVVTITEPMNNVDKRLEDMAAVGMDRQVLSLSIPGPDPFEPEEGLALAQISNEAIAEVVRKYPQHFSGLASVPLKNLPAAIQELERAVKELGLQGVIMGTNIDGLPVDHPDFWPFYEAVEALKVPLLVHPMTPIGKEAMNHYRLAPMIGFESDICLAVVRLVLSGILAKFPTLKVIVSHLGGAIPYLIERIDNCYRAYPECREHIDELPSTYLQQLYYDTVSFYLPALWCAYQFTTAHKLILGSDYPHVIGDIARSITSIEQLDISSEEKEQIFSGNLLRLLNRSK